MLDEEMDDMIRRAAENHHPSYNDKAWEKMEMQLDKHLPQKRDRKKLIFFLLFFLLLGGGMLFTINRFMGNKEQLADIDPGKKGLVQPAAQSLATDPVTAKNTTLTSGNGDEREADGISVTQPVNNGSANTQPGDDRSTNNQAAGNRKTFNAPNDNKTVPGLNDQQNKNDDNTVTKLNTQQKNNDDKSVATLNDQQNKNAGNGDMDNLVRNKRSTKKNKGKAKINIAAAKPFEEPELAEDASTTKKKPIAGKTTGKLNAMVTAADPVENPEDKSIAPNSTTAKNEADTKIETKLTTEPEKEITKVKQEEKEKEPAVTENKSTASTDKKKPEKKFASNFGLTFSVGPDASFVSLKRFGKINLTYGAGLSYTIKDRITVRTGFYATKKIYTATPEQYDMGGVTYPHLVGIDANCKVYEIPLSVAYNFGQRKNHNWFGNVGLSSFIMKNEHYTYNYKNYGQSYSYNKEVSNENKHYFGVLTLSGGYNYRFNKRVSIQAEPYVQLPLSGIGLGKLKLNSTGVLFTVTVKPFAKKK